MEKDMKKQKLVLRLIEKGFLTSPDFITSETSFDTLSAQEIDSNLLIMNSDVFSILEQNKNITAEWMQFESALFQKETSSNQKQYFVFLKYLRDQVTEKKPIRLEEHPVRIIYSEEEEPHKRSVKDFIAYFNTRFKLIEGYLKSREELSGIVSISRLIQKKEREDVAVIGMIKAKHETKNNNIILTLEDKTGCINVLISKTKPDLYAIGADIVLDDIIGVVGTSGNKIVFANNVLLPDIPLTRELKKADKPAWAAFLGDPHFGSKAFLKNDFERFLTWIRGEAGSPAQKEIAGNLQYLFIVGDLVEGVGLYPGQEDDLEIMEVKQQYAEFAKYIKRIPAHIKLIICPGNHDAGRISEPQLALYEDYAAPLYARPNTFMVSNPAMVNIAASEDFSGFDVLLYHGYSLIYYAENVPSIKAAGGQKRPDLVLKHLLVRRHLAPTHTSNLYIPYPDKDPLVISKIPDFFATGHIHRVSVANYRNTTLLNCSCWTAVTEDQEKRGLEPQPGKLPVVNLQTREVKVLNFLGK